MKLRKIGTLISCVRSKVMSSNKVNRVSSPLYRSMSLKIVISIRIIM